MHLRQIFLQNVAQTSATPLMLEIEKGKGVYLFDKEGKSYIDLIAGIGVSSLGHCHPAVVQAIKEQADRYLHTMVYGEYVMEPQVKLAALLTQSLPAALNSVYFVNSGAEATEGAMKLAKRHTGRHQIIACRHAYHGSTQGAASLMNPTTFTQAYYPLLPGIAHIEYNTFEDIDRIDEHTACVIIETVQAEWGVRPPHPGYLEQIRQRCNEVGALLVLDEIQVGYGRTGSLFAFEQYGIVPDILLLAKGMGGGMPIGAFIADQSVMRALSENPILGHITTFGGHPVSCAAALATLQTLLTSELVAGVQAKSALFISLLKHPKILDLRHAGLLLAVELADFDSVWRVIMECLEEGLIIDWFLFNNRSLRLAPPLIITEEEIRQACAIILKALDKL